MSGQGFHIYRDRVKRSPTPRTGLPGKRQVHVMPTGLFTVLSLVTSALCPESPAELTASYQPFLKRVAPRHRL